MSIPLSPLLSILSEVLNSNLSWDERTAGVKIKRNMYKLQVYPNNLVIILEDPVEGIEILILKLKDFEVLALKLTNKRWRCEQRTLRNKKLVLRLKGKKWNTWVSLWLLWIVYCTRIIMLRLGKKSRRAD